MLYFGVKELCDSTKWNQQYALIRNEETFDSALPKANRYVIATGRLAFHETFANVGWSAVIAEPF